MNTLHVPCNSGGASGPSHEAKGKECVSFGTNMSSDEDISDGASMEQEIDLLPTAVERFHTIRFRERGSADTGKHSIHKVVGSGNSKKQRTPIKQGVKAAIRDMLEDVEDAAKDYVMSEVPKELQEERMCMEATSPNVEPTNLMGTHSESYQ
jgi:hypothetical protein